MACCSHAGHLLLGVAILLTGQGLQGVLLPVRATMEIEAKYARYLDRQAADVEAYRRDEALLLPDGFDYGSVPGLSNEISEKLSRLRPETLGQAGRVPGVTPAALVVLLRHVKRARRANAA